MNEKAPSMLDLLKGALEEESAGLRMPEDKAMALAVQLRAAFPQLAQPVSAADRAYLALGEERGERWHRSVLGAVKVVAGKAGGQARLILGHAAEVVGGAPTVWQFSHACNVGQRCRAARRHHRHRRNLVQAASGRQHSWT
jgi:hypothetical protein